MQPIQLSKDQLNTIVDNVFAWIKTAIPFTNIFARVAEEAVHTIVKVGLDELYDVLVSKGVLSGS